MFHRVHEYALIEMNGRWYRPRAYGEPQPDGTWDGWLVFFPLGAAGSAIASDRETTQSTFQALTTWAAGLTPVYLDGALARAARLAEQPPVVARLEAAEYDALEDAERLETAASIERIAADVDEAAAAGARAEADRIHRERLATEGALAASEEAAANLEADIHEQAARDARAVAADAGRRSRNATAKSTRVPNTRSQRGKKR